MMQAAVLTRFNEPLEIKQVEIPKPGPDDVLIKMIACGVCHTDLHFVRGGKDARSYGRPFTGIAHFPPPIRLGTLSVVLASYSGP